MASLNSKLFPVLKNLLAKQKIGCSSASFNLKTDRLFSCHAKQCQLQNEQGTNNNVMSGKVDRFGGVTVNLHGRDVPPDITEGAFRVLLQDSLVHWKAEGRVAVWLLVPISQSRLVGVAASQGFTFHHAQQDQATLSLWMGEGESRLPGYATHQIGVAGSALLFTKRHAMWPCDHPEDHVKRCAVLDAKSGKVLVVQDKNKTKNAWKFPGGLSDPGENIGATAVREVFEETGVRAEFESLLSVRQQHDHPGAFGTSDMYIICRLRPLTFHISLCTQECLRCEWMDLAQLARTNATTPITSRIARLLLYGYREGFEKIDLSMEEMPAVYSGKFYQLYHRELPESYKHT